MEVYYFIDSMPFNIVMTLLVQISVVVVPAMAALSLMAHK